MEITKIVVGVDFSEQSEVAVREAVQLARHTGAEVVLVHVGTVINNPVTDGSVGVFAEWETLVREQLAADRKQLEALRERYEGQGVDVSHMIIDGFPDTGLVQAAVELGAELIVTGSHGRTGLKRWLLGSVAERTTRLSSGAVLVARPGGNVDGGYHRILVPTDFSDFAEAALQTALVVAAPGASVELVNFWQLPMVTAGDYTPIHATEADLGPVREAMTSEADRHGKELVGRYRSDRVNLTFEAVQAGATYGILDRAGESERSYDLIVLGSHGRRGFRRFILGSVAETVLRHAKCSVMVVHGEHG